MKIQFNPSQKVIAQYKEGYKVFSLLLITAAMLLTSCGSGGNGGGGQAAGPTATLPPPEATFTPAPTSTSTPTSTPTLTPTPRLPVLPGTQMPVSSTKISANNVDQVVELARWGKGVITDAGYSPDGKLIAVASTLGVSLYQADSLQEILYFETNASVNSLAFSSDGKTIATGLNDNTVKLWKASDGTLLKSFDGHTDEKAKKDAKKAEVTSVAFSPDGGQLAGGSTDGTVSLWKASDGSLVNTLKAHKLNVSSVFFSPDGQALFSASSDGTVRMTNVSDGKLVRAFSGGERVIDATISADGKTLATYTHDFFGPRPSLILWNVQDGKKLQTIKGNDQYSYDDIGSLAFSPDGQFIAAGWRDHTAKIWSVTSGIAQSTFDDLQPKDGWYYYISPVVAFSLDGQSLLMTDSIDIGIWDVKKGSLLNRAKLKSEGIIDLALSPDEKTLASIEGPNVNLLQISDGSVLPNKDQIQSIGSLAFSPDGMTLLVSMFDKTARLWPLSDQGIRKSFETEKKEYIRAVAFSPDGQVVALGVGYPGGAVELRQVADGVLLKTLSLGTVYGFGGVAFSSSGEFLGVSIDGQIKVYRVADGKLVKLFKGGLNVAFSPDNTLVAGGGEDKTVRVWKIPGGETLLTLKDRPDRVNCVIFSPDGTLLVSGSDDGTIEVFLASDGTLLKSWKADSRGISDLIFSSDGKLLISSSWDGTIRMWGLKP